jgi:hypothetical protein
MSTEGKFTASEMEELNAYVYDGGVRLDGLIAEVAELSDKLAQITEHLSSMREGHREAERIVVEHGGAGAIEPGYEDSATP